MSTIKKNSNNYIFLLLGIFLVLTGRETLAQTQKFQKIYGGYSYDYGNDLIQTSDTGYLLLCTSNSFSASSDIYLLKVDKLGNYVWQHTYGGAEIEGACKIKFTQDGNLAMAGHTSSFLNNSYDFYLIKATMEGDTIWTKHYGTAEWDFANSMDTCADGGFIMAGKTYDTGNAYSDILVIKTDAQGEEQWRKKIGGTEDDVANAIVSVPDGYLICGTTATGIYGGSDIYVLKLDLTGNIVWQNYDGEQFDDEGTGIYFSTNGDIIIAGKKRTVANPENFNTNIRKLSQNGNFYWTNPYFTSGAINIEINSIIEGYNNKITSIGSFDGNSPGINDMVMFMWDSIGYYNNSGTYGGSVNDYGENIIKTLDGGYAMLGATNSFGSGLWKIFFVKTDTVLPSNAPISVQIGIEDKRVVSNNKLNYPNPFNLETNFEIDIPFSKINYFNVKLELYDSFGSNVVSAINFNMVENNSATLIRLTNVDLKNGCYFYSIFIDDKIFQSGKFVITE